MNGVTIIETEVLERVIATVQAMEACMVSLTNQLAENTKPYLSVTEVCALTGFGKTWVNDNKADIGFSSVGGSIRFRRQDVVAFMEANYFKSKKRSA